LAAAKVEPPASGQAAEPSDPVITIANTEIAAKAESLRLMTSAIKPILATTKAKSTMAAARVEPPVIGQSAEPSDQVITMAKTAIAAKLEVPASAEFGEMKRAFRKNTLGKSVDSICGRVKGKKRRARIPEIGRFYISSRKMMHTWSMAHPVQRRRARIATFAISLEQNRD
jgi:hypothetical protein